jgi:hypothetical protein
MRVERAALVDRLLAEQIAAPVRDPEQYRKADRFIRPIDAERYLRVRSEMIRADLRAEPADIAWAFDKVHGPSPAVASSIRPMRIVTALSRTGSALLQPNGREMRLRVERDEPGREILRWRFVSLALPASILMAAASRHDSALPESVQLLDSSFAPDQPVAQHHLHHAAALSFEELWASVGIRVLLRPGDLVRSVRSELALCPRLHAGPCLASADDAERELGRKNKAARARHMSEWAEVIRQAWVARRLLDRHSYHGGPLDECSVSGCKASVRGAVRHFSNGRSSHSDGMTAPYPWPEELVRLARQVRNAMAPAILRRSHRSRTGMMSLRVLEERAFLIRGFKYLRADDQESPDPVYEKLFVQYLRVKAALFGLVTHPPGERGLSNFLNHFSQIKIYAPEADLDRPRPAREPGLQVRSTEYRVAPDAWFAVRLREDRAIEDGPVDDRRVEAAWLIHFKRKTSKRSLPLYGSVIRGMESEADQIVRALTNAPCDLRRLRGIDICGVEEDQPCWVAAQTLRRVRVRSRQIAAAHPRLCLEPLRLTVHAGEDFLWLTSGVRAVAEPFHWNLIERGDRIGHGIAVTLDPQDWWTRWRGEVVPVKRLDRLLDLAFLAEYSDRRTPDEERWLKVEIEATLRDLTFVGKNQQFSDMEAVDAARRFWRCLGSPLTRRLMASFEPPDTNALLHERWIYRYLWSRDLQELAATTITVRIEDDRHDAPEKVHGGSSQTECDLLIRARQRLILEIARWQVCIESNPSSNLIVGGLDSMAAQDFLHHRPTSPKTSSEVNALTWTISTDDPITFATTLADEYAYAWAGMILREKDRNDPAYARALLDEAAATSMRMRFSLPGRRDTKDFVLDLARTLGYVPPDCDPPRR